MKVDPDPVGFAFVGAYMADLNTDDTVWMTAIPNLYALDAHVAVEVEDANEGDLESEIGDPETLIPPDQADVNGNPQELTGVTWCNRKVIDIDISTHDNVWINGELISWGYHQVNRELVPWNQRKMVDGVSIPVPLRIQIHGRDIMKGYGAGDFVLKCNLPSVFILQI